MSWDTKKIAVCTVMISLSGTAAGFGCPAVVDSVWVAGIMAAQSSISAAIAASVETISAARVVNLERIQGTLRIVTKQVNVSSEKGTATDVSVKQAISSAAVDASNRKAIFNTIMDFNPVTGQGVDPCGNLKRSQSVAVAIGEASTDMQEKVLREIDNAPGSFVANQGASLAKRVADSKTNYCTADEVRAGVCQSVGALPGRDVDAGNFFTTANTTSAESAAKSALLNNMYGVPYEAPSKAAVGTASGKSFIDAKRSEDAFRSVSQASFKTIQSWTESRGPASNPEPSVLDAISQKVGMYSGGDNYDTWEQGLTSQTERGLLVEYAKMSAAELYMLDTEYQQMTRMEANVAALFAMRYRNTASTTASSNAVNTALQSKVR